MFIPSIFIVIRICCLLPIPRFYCTLSIHKWFSSTERIYTTVGTHPTRCEEFVPDPEGYYDQLRSRIKANRTKVRAVGECGLDYDRLHFCAQETQRLYFEKQLDLAAEFKLPLFLHMRNAAEDFMGILERNRNKIEECGGGVVHSFTGTLEEAQRILPSAVST